MTKIVLITGATDGLGRAVAERLAGEGHTVLAHGRSEEKLADVPGAARTYRADLASLGEVRALAAEVLEAEPRIDVLVNNAGIGFGSDERSVSADGIELRFAVNYLAGFLLTTLLLERLRASAPARIVNVASGAQQAIDFADPLLEHGYRGGRAYAQSKLAQVMHAFDLAADLLGSDVTATALHPGTYLPTKMVLDEGITPLTELDRGVDAVARLAGSPEVEGVSGRYFDGVRPATPDPQAEEPEARRLLHELSRELADL